MPSINPLGQEHLAAINAVLANAPAVRELIQRCKKCGLPVDDAEQQHNQQVEFLTAVRTEFFPGH